MRQVPKYGNGLYRRGLVITLALVGVHLTLWTVVQAADTDQPRTDGTSANPIVIIAPNEVERWLRVGNETGPQSRWQMILDELTSPVGPDALGRQALELTPENVTLLRRAGMGNLLTEALGTTPLPVAGNEPPLVTITSPAAGASFAAETPILIEWTLLDLEGDDIVSVDLFASFDNQATFLRIAPSLPGSATSLPWIIPNRPLSAVIRVEASDNFGTGVKQSTVFIEPLPPGLVPTTLTDFDQPGTQPFDHIMDFRNPTICAGCHANVPIVNKSPVMSDAEPYFFWRGTMMANASYDPLFEACLAIAEQDAPGSGDLCIRCHIPNAWLNGRSTPTSGSAVLDTDRLGVSCDICHRMVDPIADAENPIEDDDVLAALINVPAFFGTGRTVLDPNGLRRGPTNPDLLANPHPAVESPFHREAAICGTCHNVSNPVFENDGSGNYVFNAANTATTNFDPGNVAPIERTYSEWLASDYNTPGGVDTPAFGGFVSTCQDCHMRDVGGKSCNYPAALPRTDMPQHDLTGGSTWMMGVVLPAVFTELGVDFSLDAQLDAAQRGRYMLQNAAELEAVVVGDQLKVTVTNQTGHKLPTGYPDGRRMWIHVEFADSNGVTISESGAYDLGTGELTHDSDVKIYESQPGPSDAVAALTGLPATHGFHFVLNNKIYKDNRIPPRGFTNAAFEAFGGAPVDYSYADGQYWDDTFYTIPCGATVAQVHLRYQSTSKEYIEFLRDANTTNDKGQRMYGLWIDHDKCPPEVMAQTYLLTPDGDGDGDGVLDRCDVCEGWDDNVDTDNDTVPDGCDVCPGSDDNVDTDLDGVADGCDLCEGSDDNVDTDNDGVPDGCDLCAGDDASGDTDGDGVCDDIDLCPLDNPDDDDGDGVCNSDDVCPGVDDTLDCNESGIPDCLELDCDDNGVLDDCELGLFDGYALEMQTGGVRIPLHGSNLFWGSSFSWEFWAAPSAVGVGAGYPFLQFHNDDTTVILLAGYRGDDSFVFGFGGGNELLVGPFPNDRDIWHHWAGTYNTDGNVRKLYRDGQLVGQDVAGADVEGHGAVYLGGRNFGFWNGRLDEVRWWRDTVRSESDIQASRNLSTPIDQENLNGHFHFDEPSGTIVFDSSPAIHHGQFVGSVTRFKTIVGALPDCNLNGTIDVCEPDTDGDGVIDDCDPCPLDNPDDPDADGVCTSDDACPGFDDNLDADADTVPDGCDVCPGSDDTIDSDFDGVPDGCDICDGFDDALDEDNDTVPDGCDACPGSDDALDADNDTVPDGCDACPGSDDSLDADGDGVPDGCDACPGSNDNNDADNDGVPDGCDPCPDDNPDDTDGDGVCDSDDICPGFFDNFDCDNDGTPDGCDDDPCPEGACCMPDKPCAIIELHLCVGGSWQEGGICPNACIVDVGACCMPDESCVDDTEPDDCFAQGGFWAGPDTTCPTACDVPTGACCLPDDSCIADTVEDDCFAQGGFWAGSDTTCPTACALLTGACCIADGVCEIHTSIDCASAGGVYRGHDTLCDGEPCLLCGFANPSFETGDFTGWTAQDLADPFFPLQVVGVGTTTGFPWPWSSTPTEGSFTAFHGFSGSTSGSPITLAQVLTVTDGGLSFDWRAGWDLNSACCDRVFDVVIRTTGGDELARFNIRNATAGTVNMDTGPQSSLVDLSAYLGQTVEVAFEWTIPEDGAGPGQFQLDNICIEPLSPCYGSDSFLDLDDYANFVSCLLGPGVVLNAGCDCFDFDGDGYVTLADFSEFQVDFMGN